MRTWWWLGKLYESIPEPIMTRQQEHIRHASLCSIKHNIFQLPIPLPLQCSSEFQISLCSCLGLVIETRKAQLVQVRWGEMRPLVVGDGVSDGVIGSCFTVCSAELPTQVSYIGCNHARCFQGSVVYGLEDLGVALHSFTSGESNGMRSAIKVSASRWTPTGRWRKLDQQALGIG